MYACKYSSQMKKETRGLEVNIEHNQGEYSIKERSIMASDELRIDMRITVII